jgi:hypothetical protein
MVDSFGVSRVSVRRFGPAPASVARRLWPPGSYFNPFEVLDDEWAQDLLPPMMDLVVFAGDSEDDDAPEDPRSEASSSSGPENPAAHEDSEDDASISSSAVEDPFFDVPEGDSDISVDLGSEDTISVVSSDEGFVSDETNSMDEEYEPPSPISSGEEWLPEAGDMGDSDSE